MQLKLVWEITDIKAGTKVKKLAVGDPPRYVNFIIANYFDGPGTVWGIFHVEDGEFIRVGSGIQEAVLQHLNNCGFKPMDAD